MTKDRKITFFMLVTNRDCMIADYCIRSYGLIHREQREFGGDDFVLHIYLNCLSEENRQRYAAAWAALPYTLVHDNAPDIAAMAEPPRAGQPICSHDGHWRRRDDDAICYDELWSDELPKFQTPFVATVDADFEILHPRFYFDLMDRMAADPSVIGASSDYGECTYLQDSYSKRWLFQHRRNETWFCIYRREAFTHSQRSHFYCETTYHSGLVHAYDSAAWFQEELRQRFRFIHTPLSGRRDYLHYGAGSKNRSLTAENIGSYRRMRILSECGFIHGAGNPIVRKLNAVCRLTCRRLFRKRLARFAAERRVHVHDTIDA